MLPVSMVMGQSVSAGRLDDPKGKYQIKCLQPGRRLRQTKLMRVIMRENILMQISLESSQSFKRIPIAGKISTMVFDKTGTITKAIEQSS